MSLMGYGPQLVAGTWETIKLAILSLIVAVLLGLIAASAKLSKNRVARFVARFTPRLYAAFPI